MKSVVVKLRKDWSVAVIAEVKSKKEAAVTKESIGAAGLKKLLTHVRLLG